MRGVGGVGTGLMVRWCEREAFEGGCGCGGDVGVGVVGEGGSAAPLLGDMQWWSR